MNHFKVQNNLFARCSMRYFFAIILITIGSDMNIYSQSLDDYKLKLISDTTIFPQGTFKACHASTIVELTPGSFMAAWFAGSFEGASDVGIWTSTLEDNHWSSPVKVASGSDSLDRKLPCWNPVLFKAKENTLLLFYKIGPNPREWWGMIIKSSDNGKTWSQPQKLPEGFLGPIKNKPIQLSNGNILCPSSIESTDAKKWTVHLEITDENISKWKRIDIEADSIVGVIQPSILRHPDGKLQMLCRSRQNLIYQTWSNDNGEHWNKLTKTSLPNPNSGIDAVVLDNGLFLLVYNPLLQGSEWFNGRNVLNVAVSKNGEDWKDVFQLENEKDGEFSYPAIIQASDKSIHITYTSRRNNIKHIVFK